MGETMEYDPGSLFGVKENVFKCLSDAKTQYNGLQLSQTGLYNSRNFITVATILCFVAMIIR